MTKKLTPWTSPATGEIIQTFPISQVTLTLQVKRQMPEPKAPPVEVNIAGQISVERNYADPDYALSVKNWEKLINLEVLAQTLYRLAQAQALNEKQQTEVKSLRAEMNGAFEGVSNKYVWLTEMAIGNDKEVSALIRFVSGQADPDKKKVDSDAKNFRGETPGA